MIREKTNSCCIWNLDSNTLNTQRVEWLSLILNVWCWDINSQFNQDTCLHVPPIFQVSCTATGYFLNIFFLLFMCYTCGEKHSRIDNFLLSIKQICNEQCGCNLYDSKILQNQCFQLVLWNIWPHAWNKNLNFLMNTKMHKIKWIVWCIHVNGMRK